MALNRIEIPEWFNADFPSHLEKAPVIPSTGKIVANFTQDAEITNQQKFDRGVTHLQNIYDTTFPKNRKCYIMKPDGFGSSTPSDAQIHAFADSTAGFISPESAFGDQFGEGDNNLSLGDYYTLGGKFYQRMCEKLSTRAIINNWFGTYDSGLANFNNEFFKINGLSDRNPMHARFVAALGSQAGARKKAQNVDLENPSSPQGDDAFYTSGFHEWCNSFVMSLYANEPTAADWFYYMFFEAQRKYAAKIDARTVVYTSPWTQSVLTLINTHARNPGWIQEAEGGYWKFPNWHIVPLERMRWVGYYGSKLTDGCFSWETGVTWSKNKANRKLPNIGPGYAPQPTWVSTGGSAPTLETQSNSPVYPPYPQTGNDAMTLGAQQYGLIADIAYQNDWKYIPYTANGVSRTIRKPEDPRLFRMGLQNFGQDTILHWANDRVGVLTGCHKGNEYAFDYLNPSLTPDQKETVSFTYNGKSETLEDLEGGILHQFKGTL